MWIRRCCSGLGSASCAAPLAVVVEGEEEEDGGIVRGSGAGEISFSGYWYFRVWKTGVEGERRARWAVPWPGFWAGPLRKGLCILFGGYGRGWDGVGMVGFEEGVFCGLLSGMGWWGPRCGEADLGGRARVSFGERWYR